MCVKKCDGYRDRERLKEHRHVLNTHFYFNFKNLMFTHLSHNNANIITMSTIIQYLKEQHNILPTFIPHPGDLACDGGEGATEAAV